MCGCGIVVMVVRRQRLVIGLGGGGLLTDGQTQRAQYQNPGEALGIHDGIGVILLLLRSSLIGLVRRQGRGQMASVGVCLFLVFRLRPGGLSLRVHCYEMELCCPLCISPTRDQMKEDLARSKWHPVAGVCDLVPFARSCLGVSEYELCKILGVWSSKWTRPFVV